MPQTKHPGSQIAETLDESKVDRNPVQLFQRWLEEARAAGLPLPEAMTLATATAHGRPSARMVLLKQCDDSGFVFYTNFQSAKARELDANPLAALVFFWPPLERQVRVEGKVEIVTAAEADEYFKTRPRESQIGAWASPQSEVIASREILESRVKELDKLYLNREVARPDYWGGYRLRPDRIEFWKGRIGRLHDRIVYERSDDDDWTIKRLAP